MKLQTLLETLKQLLEKENKLLTKLDSPDELLKILEEKQSLLCEISKFDKEEIAKYRDILEEIEFLTKKNQTLADNNIKFIDELFSSIFDDSVEKYDPYGNLSKENKSGIFNKKI